ncbi:LysR family transcriptional regulator [Stappia sp.]|uniref:LysR family transcriptional regulator n=1 Tax=Stappia sp. TaxID=1870903 RepID=UPI003A9932F0
MKDNRLLEMRVFRAVVEAGGFRHAADQLGVSQPFVSQSVSAMETRLGVKLLHRSTRGHRLTGEGQTYYSACIKAIETIDAVEGEVTAATRQAAGDLRVSAPIAFGTDQIVPRIPTFLVTHPEVNLVLSLTDRFANLIEENIDVAVRMGRLDDSSLMSRKLCDLQRVVVASPAFLAAHGPIEHPHDLARFNCLTWEGRRGHLNRWPFVIDGAMETVSVSGNFRSANGLSLVQMCMAGVGIMRMAEHLANPAIARGDLVRLLVDFQARDETAFHAVYLPERRLLPRARLFIDYLAEAFRDPPWQSAD